MKKVIFVIVFVLLATAVFGQTALELLQQDVFITSSEEISASMLYLGKNSGAEVNATIASNPGYSPLTRLSNDYTDILNRMLNRYQNTAGDTYQFFLFLNYIGGPLKSGLVVICEFTSRTEYRWWAYRTGG